MRPLISVVMITYNHELYIKEAIEGVLMQEGNFELELIIANDTSNDNTDFIVREIISSNSKSDRIKYFNHTSNLGMHKNYIFAVEQSKGDYIALCEGDDYWTDKFKLQEQISFLENNLNYGLVFTNYKELYKANIISLKNYSPKSGNVFISLLLHEFYIATLTVVVRAYLLKKALAILKDYAIPEKWKMGDYPLWLELSLITKFHYINSVTAIYRISLGSASNPKNINNRLEFLNSVYSIKLYFAAKEEVSSSVLEMIHEDYHNKMLSTAFWNKKYKIAARSYSYFRKKGKEYCTTKRKLYLFGSKTNISFVIAIVLLAINKCVNFKSQ